MKQIFKDMIYSSLAMTALLSYLGISLFFGALTSFGLYLVICLVVGKGVVAMTAGGIGVFAFSVAWGGLFYPLFEKHAVDPILKLQGE